MTPSEYEASQPPVVQLQGVGNDVRDLPDMVDSPGWLHPSSVVFEASAQIRQFIFPVVVGLLGGAASGNLWSLWVAVPVLAVSMAFNLIRYFTLRYQVQDNELVVTEGLLFRRIRSVPIRRIQNIDYVQNLFHRLLGVAVVNVETASGDKPEATLRVIKLEQVQQLRRAVFRTQEAAESGKIVTGLHENAGRPTDAGETQAGSSSEVLAEAIGSSSEEAAGGEQLWAITPKQLIIAGLTSNRGTVLIGIVAGYFFQPDWGGSWRGKWSRDDLRASSQQLRSYLPEQFQAFDGTLQVLLAIVALLVILRVVSVIWYFLRFYGYQLRLHGEDLRIACGLFTKVSATVPRERIQFISVHCPILMRPFGLASIRIETAGGSGNAGEDAASTVSRRWFVPVIEHQRALELLSTLRPSIDWDPHTVEWKGLSQRAPARMTRLGIIASILVSIIGLAITQPWGILAGVVVLPLFIAVARKKARARRFARLPWGYAYQSGLLTRKLSFTFADRVQTIDCSQSWFDRRWQMATLRLDTAAAGPASHLVEIAYLDEQFAKQEYQAVLKEAARNRPEFG